ncbi:Proto-oncogene tyrosine-protein kinase receptor Ret [Geodia barretti]|uniref:Proto-oncogene tyrosine-protein kinase receptor Ret n=1 Tax=Geodia barretti TaxID=519541 RepID=A0AA35R2C2_GEOBA|nr:Proto-oncogene tyrosine-protein kinase receptor Ret [Geodia barretti]
MAKSRSTDGAILTPVCTLLWKFIAISLYLGASTAAVRVDGVRRNLSEIRYHFTPCGAVGRLGPTYDECLRYYASVNSPIARDGVLSDTYSSRYPGSQSFRPPRVTEWNLTIAGAAGGRGLCNILQGTGLVLSLPKVVFGSQEDIIVLAGQRGLGPCDIATPEDLGHSLCEISPQNISSALECRDSYSHWLFSTFAGVASTLRFFSGGAGGGGSSFVGTRRYSSSDLVGEIVAIAGGGGGTSLLISYRVDGEFDLSTPELYREFIDANPLPYDNFTRGVYGRRGRGVGVDIREAGAGGGYSESFEFRQPSPSDGRGLNMSENFGEGGRHCLAGDVTIPERLQMATGGFGGGGGGCLEGGGGGGFTGGNVINVTEVTPGSGGYSLSNWPRAILDWHEGDGYVDIVEADCGCVHRCEVYEEEDQFQCLCPNDTLLAPDLSDCFYRVERIVSKPNATIGDDVERDFTLQAVSFGNSSYIFGVEIGWSVAVPGGKRQAEITGDLCVLMFTGENDEIVLVTEPIVRKSLNLSRIIINNGSLTTTNYTSFLDSSVLVTGAIIASTGPCIIDDTIAFNISTRDTESQGGADFATILSDLYNESSNANTLLRRVLNLPEEDEEETERQYTGVSGGVIAAIVIVAALVTVGVIVAFTVPLALWRKRRRPEKTDVVYLAEENGQDTPVVLDYVRYSSQKRPSEDLQANLGYETLNFGDNDGVLEAIEEREKFVSKYGVSATGLDFTEFNSSRANTGMRNWEYPRSKLIFMRDLGEGQFGKVMLMKAMSIAGYSGDLPVAVKTLSSRDPSVIQKFTDETDLMKKFTHPNIVSLLGVCNMSVTDDSAPLMILEYMPYGDLKCFLQDHRPTKEDPASPISESHFYSFALDVCLESYS